MVCGDKVTRTMETENLRVIDVPLSYDVATPPGADLYPWIAVDANNTIRVEPSFRLDSPGNGGIDPDGDSAPDW